MGEVLSLGLLAIAAERLLAVILIWVFLAFASSRRFGFERSWLAWTSVSVGVVAARSAYILENWTAFSAEPVSMLYLWQGGFSGLWGVAAAALVLVVGLPRTKVPWAASALAVLSGIWFGAQSLGRVDPKPFPLDANLVALDAKSSSSPIARGEPFVVNLWASWCPPCRREMPMVAEAAKTSAVPILLVNQGEEATVVRQFAANLKLPTERVLLDLQSSLSGTAGGALPATIFVDARGKIQSIHHGEISRAALHSGIQNLTESSK